MTNENDIKLTDISFMQPWPVKHMTPSGHLPATVEAACLWQFCIMAMQALDRVEKQVTLEGEQDQEADLMQLAESAMKIFSLEPSSQTKERVFNDSLIALAKAEAIASRLFWDTRLDAWFASGGRSYRIVERNADKVGQ